MPSQPSRWANSGWRAPRLVVVSATDTSIGAAGKRAPNLLAIVRRGWIRRCAGRSSASLSVTIGAVGLEAPGVAGPAGARCRRPNGCHRVPGRWTIKVIFPFTGTYETLTVPAGVLDAGPGAEAEAVAFGGISAGGGYARAWSSPQATCSCRGRRWWPRRGAGLGGALATVAGVASAGAIEGCLGDLILAAAVEGRPDQQCLRGDIGRRQGRRRRRWSGGLGGGVGGSGGRAGGGEAAPGSS